MWACGRDAVAEVKALGFLAMKIVDLDHILLVVLLYVILDRQKPCSRLNCWVRNVAAFAMSGRLYHVHLYLCVLRNTLLDEAPFLYRIHPICRFGMSVVES